MNSPSSNNPQRRKRALREPLRFPEAPVPAPAPAGFFPKLRRLGPGFVTGAADVDPSLVLTATVAGAVFGYSLLWVVLLCVPFLVTLFKVAGRIGAETKQGLMDLLRVHYGKRVAISAASVLIVINMAMIVADMMAVSDALSVLTGQPRMFFVAAVAFIVWYVLIFRDYQKITHALLWLSVPLFVYVAAAIVTGPRLGVLVWYSFIPHVTRDSAYVTAMIGVIGSLLTPYILVWQTSSRREQVQFAAVAHGPESHTGTAVTTILSYSIVVAAASVLHSPTAADMTTRVAAEALRPAVGDFGPIVFAIGIIGAGLVALPVLIASMCYSVAESLGWRSGLSERPWEATRFYILISAAVFLAAALNFARVNPVRALFLSQVLAGVLTLPILIAILVLANDRRIMRSTNSRADNFWIGAAAGGLCSAALIWLWWKIF